MAIFVHTGFFFGILEKFNKYYMKGVKTTQSLGGKFMGPRSKTYTIYGHPELFDKIKDAAWEDRMSYSKKIEQIFREYLERREAQNNDEL
jgi:hypothetical protein